jgi:hypothetical protein
LAPGYAAEGHRYKAELQSANAEVKRLIGEAKSLSHPSDSFKSYQAVFKSAQSEHESVQSRYVLAKSANERAKERFEQAKRNHQQAKEAFQDRLASIKAEKASREVKNRGMLMVVASNIGYMDGKQVKFDYRSDGKINVFFGGIGNPDGYGHGHIVIDQESNVVYMRQPFKDKTKAIDIDIDDSRGITNI